MAATGVFLQCLDVLYAYTLYHTTHALYEPYHMSTHRFKIGYFRCAHPRAAANDFETHIPSAAEAATDHNDNRSQHMCLLASSPQVQPQQHPHITTPGLEPYVGQDHIGISGAHKSDSAGVLGV